MNDTKTSETIQAIRTELGRANYLLNRALGIAPIVTLGERVRIRPEARAQLALPDDVFTVTTVVGSGADAMTTLKAPDGRLHSWFRATELLPAAKPEASTPGTLNASNALMRLANAIAKERGISLSAATKAASTQRPDWATAHREMIGEPVAESVATVSTLAADAKPVISLAARPGESFDELATRYAIERKVSLREAIHAVGLERPDLARAR